MRLQLLLEPKPIFSSSDPDQKELNILPCCRIYTARLLSSYVSQFLIHYNVKDVSPFDVRCGPKKMPVTAGLVSLLLDVVA